jgi:hypothetical protein
MVKRLLLLSTLLLSFGSTDAQTYSYNFGTLTDSITSGSATSPTFLTSPTDAATAYARVGIGGGKVVVKDYGFFGNGSALRIQAPTTASANKFAIADMSGASTTFGIRFSFSLGDSLNSATSSVAGTFAFLTGSGNTFSTGNTLTGSQTFTGIQLTCGAAGATAEYRNGANWAPIPLMIVPYGTTTDIAIYGNNGASSVIYTGLDDASHVLPSNSWDLYSGGVFVANFSKAQLPTDSIIRSFQFYGLNSPNNLANVFIDDIVYTNNIVNNTLPLKLTYFDAVAKDNIVNLYWRTETESDIDKYFIEHSTDGTHFSEIASVTAKGQTGSDYSYTHQNPAATNYYRLRIHNPNGSSEYSQIVAARFTNTVKGNVWYFNNTLLLDKHGDATVSVYDLSGKRVINTNIKESDYSIDVSFLAPGIYVAHVGDETDAIVVKFAK